MKCPKCKADNPDDSQFCRKCATPLTKIPATFTSPPPEKEKKEKDEKSALDFAPGQYFGKRYQIIEEIGRGGMGRVYKALDKELNRTVALKMIKPEISSHPGIVERFKKEIKLASQITHENVCRIHDLGEVKGIKYISMKFIEGQNLQEVIQTTKRLNVDTTIRITEQICQALTAAHKKGVIHRDLKPQNIMIDKKGNAYVMDFGIARSLEAEELTKPGVVIGTPQYMSPEQAEGKGIDTRSDIYSLGCIIYEMLTGKPPFEADTSVALLHKHLKEAPRPPSKFNPQIPKSHEMITLKCLEKEPDKRYQSADEIIRAIDKLKREFKPELKPKLKSWKLILPLAALILIIIAIGFYFIIRKEKAPAPPAQPEWKNSIAVLPFRDMSQKKDQEYFCDGMTEELINSLTKIKDLRVIARTSSFAFKGKHEDIREIGRKLDVETLLEGSVRKSGNRLRITAQLVNVADGSHLWSERYDREMADVFAIQDEISQAIVNKLRIKLGGEEKALLVKRYTEDLEAYNLYLKGRYYWNKRTEDGFYKGLEHFQQVIEKDPAYALAYSGIADCYRVLGSYFYLPPKEAYPRAKAAAEKALELDETLAEAHTSLAANKVTYDWDWSAAEREYKRAIELNPGYATAHHWYALYLTKMGMHDESIAEAKRAQELDPFSLIISAATGAVFFYARQYDRAIEQYQKTLEMDPNFILAHKMLGDAYTQKGMYKEAIAEVQKGLDLSGGDPWQNFRLGYIYSLSGRKDEAMEVLNELLELSKEKYVSPVDIALIYAGLGQKDQAFEWLEKAYEERNSWLVWLKVTPYLDSLRSDPRFTALLKKMNLE